MVPARANAAADEPCRLRGVAVAMRCGQISRPENPDRPQGHQINIGFAVLPALATPALADPVVVLAGGPGQAATAVAGPLSGLLAALNTRRDLVFIDQRGTGKSSPLRCADDAQRNFEQPLDMATEPKRIRQCLAALRSRGEVDVRQYATWIAVQDYEAVRTHLGYAQVNVLGASYGTRVALEWMRQYPDAVRSAVLDGVAPADMALPASLARDASAALEALFARCRNDATCNGQFPDLAATFESLLRRADQGIRLSAPHALTGKPTVIQLDRGRLVNLLRAPLYAPSFSAMLPYALVQVAAGDLSALATMSNVLGAGLGDDFAELMHFAVVCAEDMPRIDEAARRQAFLTPFGNAAIALYERVCAELPVRPVPESFYALSGNPMSATIPVLMLSGGTDPVTPPRHAQAVATARGDTHTLHLVAPHAGHGVLTSIVCAADLVNRFVRTASFTGLDDACLQRIPAPSFFKPPRGAASGTP